MHIHRNDIFKHENGSIVQIISIFYKKLNQNPVKYELKDAVKNVVFEKTADEIKDLIRQRKLIRVY